MFDVLFDNGRGGTDKTVENEKNDNNNVNNDENEEKLKNKQKEILDDLNNKLGEDKIMLSTTPVASNKKYKKLGLVRATHVQSLSLFRNLLSSLAGIVGTSDNDWTGIGEKFDNAVNIGLKKMMLKAVKKNADEIVGVSIKIGEISRGNNSDAMLVCNCSGTAIKYLDNETRKNKNNNNNNTKKNSKQKKTNEDQNDENTQDENTQDANTQDKNTSDVNKPDENKPDENTSNSDKETEQEKSPAGSLLAKIMGGGGKKKYKTKKNKKHKKHKKTKRR